MRVHTGEELSADAVDEEDYQRDTESLPLEEKRLGVHQTQDTVDNQISGKSMEYKC